MLPITHTIGQTLPDINSSDEKELYELRTYEIKFEWDQKLLREYLNNALGPALKRIGVTYFKVFTELGKAEPAKLWVLINYPNANTYINGQNLAGDAEYAEASKEYNANHTQTIRQN